MDVDGEGGSMSDLVEDGEQLMEQFVAEEGEPDLGLLRQKVTG